MNNNDIYLSQVLQKYSPKNLTNYSNEISWLKDKLKKWANNCYINIFDSGSHAKGTAVSLASDVDFLISLSSNCNENNGGLKSIYDSLYHTLSNTYQNTRKQNVSVRISLLNSLLFSNSLEVDVTPARKQSGNTNDHSLWVSKLNTWKKTNIQRHINDVSNSRRLNEIKLLKIWRELHHLDFPSIYLEYLLINHILCYRSIGIDHLANNFWHVLLELAKSNDNPLLSIVIDPANSNNILSELLTKNEKHKIFAAANESISQRNWLNIIW